MAETFRGSPRQVFDLLRRSVLEWLEDKAPKSAAALAYYALFALGPLLLVTVSIAGFFFGQAAASQAVTGQICGLIGDEGAGALQDMMEARANSGSNILGMVVGGIVLLLAAAGVFAQLRNSLNTVWEVEEKVVAGWKAKVGYAIRNNFLSFAAVLGVGFLLLVSLVVSTAITALQERAAGLLPGPELAWQAVHFTVILGVVCVLFALMYRYLPNAKVAWRDALVGALFTAVLFLLGQQLIGLYLAKAAMATRYGAAGAVIVILLWVYYSSLILLLGAEVTQVYANTYGEHIKPSERGEPLQEAIRKRQSPPDVEGTERTPGKAARPKRRGRPRATAQR